MSNPAFPPNYKPIGFQYGPSQPALTYSQKQAKFWRERNAEITRQNQEKAGTPTTFQDAYKIRSLEVKLADLEREAEIADSPHALKPAMSMLPPNDPIRQEAKQKYFETH